MLLKKSCAVGDNHHTDAHRLTAVTDTQHGTFWYSWTLAD